MKKLMIIAIGITVGFSSCKLFKKDNEDRDKPSVVEQTQEIIIDKSGTLPAGESVSIEKAIITGNILFLTVSYSGGCKDHAFKLYFNGNYKKSLPPKATFNLYHNSNEDACREMKTEELQFDITKAQYPGQNVLKINIPGFNNELTYNY